jgi:FkbM family methyltransferase
VNLIHRVHVIHRAWRLRLRHERQELAFLRQQILPGHTVVDIGANKGAYTYWLSKATGTTGRVVAFEPQPRLANHLHELRHDFRLANVEIVNAALSETPGVGQLLQPAANPLGGATLAPLEGSVASLEVRLETLDRFFGDCAGATVGFIKCDVEGHELSVLRGGESLLRRDRPALLLEWAPTRSTELFDYLVGLGYRQPEVFVQRRKWSFEQYSRLEFQEGFLANFAFVHASRKGDLRDAA